MTVANPARHLNSRTLPPVVMVTDWARGRDPLPLAEKLPRGTGLLFRHYEDPDRVVLGRKLSALAKRRRLVLVVAADWRLAASLGAAGIHLPEGLGRSGRLAPLLGWARRHGKTITMACHSPAALSLAARLGIHNALLSPAFATASHPGAPAIGVTRFRLWVRQSKLPVHALGGMDAGRMRALTGIAGYASVDTNKKGGRSRPFRARIPEGIRS